MKKYQRIIIGSSLAIFIAVLVGWIGSYIALPGSSNPQLGIAVITYSSIPLICIGLIMMGFCLIFTITDYNQKGEVNKQK
jgi:hypothetical protein